MKNTFYKLTTVRLLLVSALVFLTAQVFGQRQMEKLDRGVIAVRTSPTEVYIGWRLLATDPDNIKFNVYSNETLVNTFGGPTSMTNTTHTSTSNSAVYTVRPVINGVEQEASKGAAVWSSNALRVPLQKPADGVTPPYTVTNNGNVENYPAGQSYSYTPNDCSVGDLDGDGEYELIVKWDPTNSRDNSHGGYTGNVYLDAYKMDGTHLWRIDLGRNIRAGAHYTQFIVFDLDGDGLAEVACKTADATIDGVGTVIGNAAADYRNNQGRILSGPEFLTVFNGRTGAAMATTNYVPGRDPINGWGSNESYGNRVDRFLAGVGYFDGQRPSLLMCRGYYGRSVLVAWDWRNNQLTQRWKFDSNDSGNSTYGGQGFHSLSINDVDADGKDEVVYGSMVVDDNGGRLYTTRLGHGDALHVTDMDPDRPGLEVWTCQESQSEYAGMGLRLRDARTGENIFGVPTTGDIGRALAADIDSRHKGVEMWGSTGGVFNAKGVQVATNRPSVNFAVWWDADLQRELLDGNRIDKWIPGSTSGSTSNLKTFTGNSSNNSTKATPCLSADILGDWREEVILRTDDNSAIRIFTTTTPYYSNTTTNPRFYTLMHDPQYRTSIAWQNVGYNQPPHTSFYLGGGMDLEVPKPSITIAGSGVTGLKKEVKGQQTIFVYPNPSTDVFQINALGAYSYTIYDQLGRSIETGKGTGEGVIGESLKAGVYTVRIETKLGTKVERILKQ
ncbi:rhamnogalacturonan lyase family protein [Botryobacter ruber]|uniref:rhamnogalacturonan lyase family protein n=1 Tax=Botryobacter ruber TaxID=2171629 RepID=UPI000E0BD48A|nr:T9SS type A sorting domain-containing protein [Botryobacter ruber]